MTHPREQVTVALAGNPNSGKTTLFNAITGGHQHVGNYPGVTVEIKTARTVHGDARVTVVDLPGTYSLTAYSAEEVVARNFILDRSPDVVIDILDSANLERNLYLATQLMELGAPLVLAFNMSDLARARGYRIDVGMLSQLLGVPIVPTVGHRGEGVDELMDAALAVAGDPAKAVARHRCPTYGRELEPEVGKLSALVADTCRQAGRDRWVAVKLLEDDAEVVKRLGTIMDQRDLQRLLAAAEASRQHVRSVCGDGAEIILADRRYGFISGACQEAVRTTVEVRHQISDKIDAVVTNRVIGLPLFLALTLLMFQATFWLGGPLSEYLDGAKGDLAGAVSRLWPKGADSLLRSLLVDGVIEGVGAVLVFVPMIFLLFLAIALLEDSGYMARAAFVMDRLMHKIGLHGKSFVPMLIGFGCTVPAVLATRTLESRRDRLTTMMVLPLFSCSARLPIYVLILGAFFPRRKVFGLFGIADVTNQALWLMLMYLIGILLAVVAARVLRSTILRGEVTPFVMELPPYRLPTIRGALLHMWERGWMFLRKAGTVILGAVIVLWALGSFPKAPEDAALAADRRRAEGEFVASVSRGLRQVAPPDEAAGLARADLELLGARRENWVDSDRFRQALREHRDALDDLAGRDVPREGQRRFAAFLAAVRKSRPPVRGALAAAYDAYRDAEGRRDEALARIARLGAQRKLEHSAMGRVGKAIAPVMAPCGFDWKVSTALLGAFAAKEVFVSQMGVIHAVGTDPDQVRQSLRARLRADYTPLQGFCIMLFCLVSLPCIATGAATWRESASIRWALFQLGGLTLLAWGVTTAVYQTAVALGLGG